MWHRNDHVKVSGNVLKKSKKTFSYCSFYISFYTRMFIACLIKTVTSTQSWTVMAVTDPAKRRIKAKQNFSAIFGATSLKLLSTIDKNLGKM